MGCAIRRAGSRPQTLDQFALHPEFCKYLAYILVEAKDQSEELRGMAGLVLKNRVRLNFAALDPSVQQYVMHQALAALADSNALVRATAGTVTATVATKTGFKGWPALLPTLLQLLSSDNAIIVEVRKAPRRGRPPCWAQAGWAADALRGGRSVVARARRSRLCALCSRSLRT